LRRIVAWTTYVAAAAFFWGATEAFINYRWPPKGVWRTDLWLPSTYNRVVFYAVVVAAAGLVVVAVGSLIRRLRRRPVKAARRRWGGAVALAAIIASNAGWLVLGLIDSYELDVGLFKLDIQERAPFFEYWGFFALAGAAVAVALGFALGRRRWARKTGRYLRAAGAALFLATVVTHHATQMLRPRPYGPNIILIVLDAWRADTLQPELMPNLYSFSREKSLYFERAWTNGTWTLPAMTTTFTGQYHDTHKFRRRADSDKRNPTLAQILYEAGYETAAFSANRVLNRDSPTTEGFEDFYFSDWSPLLRGIHFYDTNWYGSAVRGLFHGKRISEDSRILSRMLSTYLARPHRRPYFLWVHYMDPHGPYTPPPGYYLPDDEKYILDFRPILRRRRHVNKRLYEGECRFVDDLLAPILPRLAAEPDTITIITADHGEEFWEHSQEYGFYHGKSVYETVTRVPLLVFLPAKAAAVVDTPVSLVDLAPTLLTLSGYEPPPTMQGRPFLTTDGDVVKDRRPVFIGGCFLKLRGRITERRDAVIIWPYKLILFHQKPGRRGEYYNLAADPGELRPLPEDKSAGRLRKALRVWRRNVRRTGRYPEYGGAAAPDLRALGYIQ